MAAREAGAVHSGSNVDSTGCNHHGMPQIPRHIFINGHLFVPNVPTFGSVWGIQSRVGRGKGMGLREWKEIDV